MDSRRMGTLKPPWLIFRPQRINLVLIMEKTLWSLQTRLSKALSTIKGMRAQMHHGQNASAVAKALAWPSNPYGIALTDDELKLWAFKQTKRMEAVAANGKTRALKRPAPSL